MNPLIGIAGKKASGKSTAARFFVEQGYTNLAFADPLKDAVRVIFGFDEDQLCGVKKEDPDPYWGISPREVMQVMGTEIFRGAFGAHFVEKGVWAPVETHDLWVKSLLMRVDRYDRVVVPDVRFENEACSLLARGALVINITRDTGFQDPHPSENGLPLDLLMREYPGQILEITNNQGYAELWRALQDHSALWG